VRIHQGRAGKPSASTAPKLLVWGEEDHFLPITYGERFVTEVPHSALVRSARPSAGDAGPSENDGTAVARSLARFFIA
jgi:hypothetical protein